MPQDEFRHMHYEPPRRVWYPVANGWASREWRSGELAAYRLANRVPVTDVKHGA